MNKRAHILGICGTFMGNLAILLKQQGWQISGSDNVAYPPMSHLLAEHEIDVLPYDASLAHAKNGLMVIGNALSRGNVLVEAILDNGLEYISGPAMLYQEILRKKHVIAVAGTHGKTTTTSMLAWILEYAGYKPGFLIGGKAFNFPVSAQAGESSFFVIEADEYDSAFFDKRAKFMHYRATDLAINNIEFDHSDIFADLGAIQTQFHHLIRTIPARGSIVYPADDSAIAEVLDKGCWSKRIALHKDWQMQYENNSLTFLHNKKALETLPWQHGRHNACNALMSLVLAQTLSVPITQVVKALGQFKGVARRLEHIFSGAIDVFDDFAHHPTAISATIRTLRERMGTRRLLVLLHVASNSMKARTHGDALFSSLRQADYCLIYQPVGNIGAAKGYSIVHTETDAVQAICNTLQKNDCLLIMSNGNITSVREQLVSHARSM